VAEALPRQLEPRQQLPPARLAAAPQSPEVWQSQVQRAACWQLQVVPAEEQRCEPAGAAMERCDAEQEAHSGLHLKQPLQREQWADLLVRQPEPQEER
jgi:hypothetical protein